MSSMTDGLFPHDHPVRDYLNDCGLRQSIIMGLKVFYIVEHFVLDT